MSEPERISAHTHITTHVPDGLALFYRQFANAANLQALASAWSVQVQEIEDALWAVLVATLDNATDAALDQYGALLNFARGPLADDAYRAILKSLVLARRSSGTPEDLIAVARAALGAVTFDYREGSASVLISPHGITTTIAAALKKVLLIAKDGGVALQLLNPPVADSAIFTFSTDPFRVTSDASRGFSDTTQAAGGQLAGVL